MADLLVTGVSGALGSRALPLLAQSKHFASILGVDPRPLPGSAPKLQFVRERLEDVDFHVLLQNVEAVVHLALSSDPAATRRLLDACAEHGVRHVVLVSTAAVYGAWRTNPVPLTEDSPLRPNPGFSYVVDRAEQERLVVEWRDRQRAGGNDVAVAVLRLSLVLGGGLERALAAALGGVDSYRQVHTSRPVQFLHIDDAVAAIALAVEKRLDGAFNVAPQNFVGDELARAVAGALPRPALPARLAYLANHVAWKRLYRADYADVQPYLTHPWVVSSAKLQAEGWHPEYTSEEALVAEAIPTWWGELRPGQRRAVISGSLVAASTAAALGTAGAGVYGIRRVLQARSQR